MDQNYVFRKEVKNFDLLSDERTLELVRRKDPDSINELIEHNIGLICIIARRNQLHCNDVVEFYDLIQEGVWGIREAVKFYNPDKGVKFSTYAAGWIQHYILRVLYDNRDVIRKPEKILIKEDKINKTSDIFFQKHGYYPDKEELMKMTGFTCEEIDFVTKYKMEFFDFNKVIIRDKYPLPDDILEYKEELRFLCLEIQKILDDLGKIKERDRSLFKDRYGLDAEEFFNIQSLSCLGKKYSLTKQGVSTALQHIWLKIDDGSKNDEWMRASATQARKLEMVAGATIGDFLKV